MYRGRRILAVVPARGGSVSVPRKNVRDVGGAPLLVHTLLQAAQVPEIDLTVVSTDDAEIKAVAQGAGARVIDRPAELATAEARTEPALLHALDALALAGEPAFDVLLCLEPTSPLRRPDTVAAAIRLLVDRDGPSLMTVIENRSNIGRIEDDVFRPLFPGLARRRQDRAPLYVESGTVYACRVDHLRAEGTLVAAEWLALPVPEDEAVDINSETDLAIAEALLGARERQG
ncbi:MAG: acylneuraminate cytidylyltransferase family protein [Acetobacterales bacterium]